MPANSSAAGFQGIALRNADTGTYALAAGKSNEGGWQQVSFTTTRAVPRDAALRRFYRVASE